MLLLLLDKTHILSNEPILKLSDLSQEFIFQTDGSNQSLGGMSPPDA